MLPIESEIALTLFFDGIWTLTDAQGLLIRVETCASVGWPLKYCRLRDHGCSCEDNISVCAQTPVGGITDAPPTNA